MLESRVLFFLPFATLFCSTVPVHHSVSSSELFMVLAVVVITILLAKASVPPFPLNRVNISSLVGKEKMITTQPTILVAMDDEMKGGI
jgi:hypothetical protein